MKIRIEQGWAKYRVQKKVFGRMINRWVTIEEFSNYDDALEFAHKLKGNYDFKVV